MKAKTKFLKMFYKLPKKARVELIFNFVNKPMTLNVIALEVRRNTEFGREMLRNLGYEDD